MVDPVGFVDEHPVLRQSIVASSLFEENTRGSSVSATISTASSVIEAGTQSELRSTQIKLEVRDLDNFTDNEVMAFPSRIWGYSLVTKDAGYFLVNGLRNVSWNLKRVEDLRASTQKMETVLRIASGFPFITEQFSYENKGAGLTFLFHGPSGVGKTLTAGMHISTSIHPLG